MASSSFLTVLHTISSRAQMMMLKIVITVHTYSTSIVYCSTISNVLYKPIFCKYSIHQSQLRTAVAEAPSLSVYTAPNYCTTVLMQNRILVPVGNKVIKCRILFKVYSNIQASAYS